MSDVIKTEWGHGTAAVRFGREDGLCLEFSAVWNASVFDIGFGVWPVLHHVSLGLGFLTLFVMLYRPYRQTAHDGSAVPPCRRTEEEAREDERWNDLVAEINGGIYDLSTAALERIAAIIEWEEEPHA